MNEGEKELMEYTKDVAHLSGMKWSEIVETMVLNAYREGRQQGPFDNLAEAQQFIQHNTPIAIQPMKRSKNLGSMISPFSSVRAQGIVVEELAEAIFYKAGKTKQDDNRN